MDDIFDNPKKYGMPTFEEFSKNPDKWRKPPEEIFAQVDNGSQFLKNQISKYRFELFGHQTDKLEKLYDIVRDYGIPFTALKIEPQLIPLGGGKCDVLVKFVPLTQGSGGDKS